MALEQSTHMNQLLTDIEQHHNENEIRQMASNGMCYGEMTSILCFAKVPSATNTILEKPIERKESNVGGREREREKIRKSRFPMHHLNYLIWEKFVRVSSFI